MAQQPPQRAIVVFSPDSPPQCHSPLFTDIRVPDRLATKPLLRNVCFDAQLTLEVGQTEPDHLTDAPRVATIVAHVVELDGVASMAREQREQFVLSAPWNIDGKALQRDPLDANGDGPMSPRVAEIMFGQEGFLLDKLSHIFYPRKPDDAVRVGCLRPEEAKALAPGQWVRFNAFHCRFNKCFVVTKLTPIPDRRVVTRAEDRRRKHVLYKLSITKSGKVAGCFVAPELGTKCIVADPNCFFWQSRDASRVDRVWARFAGNEAAAKFVVEEVLNQAGTGVKKLLEMNHKIAAQGIYVGGTDRRIFCPKWPLLDVSQEVSQRQEPLELLPGQFVDFEALRTRRRYVYYIGNVAPANDRRASAFRLTRNGTEFLARLRPLGDRACYSDAFGLVHDPLCLRKVNGLDDGNVFLAWIRHRPFLNVQAEPVRTASFELVMLEATEEEVAVSRVVQTTQRNPVVAEAAISSAFPQRLPDDVN